jgi:hypothetical protein
MQHAGHLFEGRETNACSGSSKNTNKSTMALRSVILVALMDLGEAYHDGSLLLENVVLGSHLYDGIRQDAAQSARCGEE